MFSKRLAIAALLLLAATPGCGKWWGENAPPAGAIALSAKKSGCGPGLDILQAPTDAQSAVVFECWVKEVQKIWTQVYGETPDELSSAELKTLVKKRILVLDMPDAEAFEKIDSGFRILGFGKKMARARLETWITLLREQRSFLHRMYHRFSTSFPELTDAEIAQAMRTTQNVIQIADWPNEWTLENVKSDLAVLLGFTPDVVRKIEASKLLLALDGDHLFQKLLSRFDWLEKKSVEIGHFYRSIVVRSESVRTAGIGRFIRAIHGYLDAVPIRAEATLEQVNQAVIELFALKPIDVEQMVAAQRLMNLPQKNFLPAAIVKSQWMGAHWDGIESVASRLKTGPESGQALITDADLSFLLGELKGLVQVAEIPPEMSFETVLKELVSLSAISHRPGPLTADGKPGPSTYAQLAAAAVVFDLPAKNFSPTILERLQVAQTHVKDIGYFYREMALKKRGLGNSGIGRFITLVHEYLKLASISPKISLADYIAQVEVIFGLDSTDRKQLDAALLLGGVRLEAKDHIYDQIMARLSWAAPNWGELERILRNLTIEELLQSANGQADFKLMLDGLRTMQWGNDFTYEKFETALVRLGAIGEKDLSILRNARDFLDLNGTHLGPKLTQRLEFVTRRWARIAEAYRYIKVEKLKPLRFQSLANIMELAGELLTQVRWMYKSSEVLEKLDKVVVIKDDDLKRLLPPMLDLGLNLFAQLCPTFTTIEYWNAKEVGECFMTLPGQLKGGEDWFNLVMNPIKRPPTDAEVVRIRKAMAALDREFKTWVGDKRRFPIHTRKVVAMASALGAEPPKDFIQSLAVVETFGGDSTRELLYPSALAHSFSSFRRYEERVLDGLPSFVRAWKDRSCKNAVTEDWGDCVPRGYPGNVKNIQLALQLRNPNYGQDVVPLNGSRYTEIMLFYTIAEEMMLAFDKDKDGIIKATAQDKTNEVVKLMNVSVGAYDTLLRFADNVKNKLNGKPIEVSSAPISFSAFNQKGLSKLVTLFATDILVTRPEDESKNLFVQFGKLLEGWTNILPESALFMDQKGIAAGVAVVSSLTDFRKAWIKIIDPKLHRALVDGTDSSAGAVKLSRKAVVQSIPSYLHAHFPRTYASCHAFGYEKSCGGILPEVLAKGEGGRVTQGDLDAITLFALGVEGLFDSCDYNKDTLLAFDLLKGQDELSCGLKKSLDVVNRLITAKILSVDSESLIQIALGVAKLHKLTEIFGKVALIEGKSSWMLLNPIKAPFLLIQSAFSKRHARASIGSFYGLATDIAAPKKE